MQGQISLDTCLGMIWPPMKYGLKQMPTHLPSVGAQVTCRQRAVASSSGTGGTGPSTLQVTSTRGSQHLFCPHWKSCSRSTEQTTRRPSIPCHHRKAIITARRMGSSISRCSMAGTILAAWSGLSTDAVNSSGYCYSCNMDRPLHPPDTTIGGRRVIRIVGRACAPWSTMGVGVGWGGLASRAWKGRLRHRTCG